MRRIYQLTIIFLFCGACNTCVSTDAGLDKYIVTYPDAAVSAVAHIVSDFDGEYYGTAARSITVNRVGYTCPEKVDLNLIVKAGHISGYGLTSDGMKFIVVGKIDLETGFIKNLDARSGDNLAKMSGRFLPSGIASGIYETLNGCCGPWEVRKKTSSAISQPFSKNRSGENFQSGEKRIRVISESDETMPESPAQELYLTLKRVHPNTIQANVIGQFIRTTKTTRVIEDCEERKTTTVNFSEVIGWGLWLGGLALSFNPGWPSTTEVLRDGLAGAGLQMAGEDIKGEGLTRRNDDTVPTGTREEVENKMKYLRPVSGVSVYFDCGPLGQFVKYTDESGNCTLTIPSLFTGKVRSVTATAVFQEVQTKALFSLP